MKTVRLQMFVPDGSELLFDLSWCDGVLTTLFAESGMLSAIERWKTGGIRELVSMPDGTRDGRMTPVSDSEFLPRLAESLRRQFGFHAVLK